MATRILVNHDSGNSLLPNGTKPLPEPMRRGIVDCWHSPQKYRAILRYFVDHCEIWRLVLKLCDETVYVQDWNVEVRIGRTNYTYHIYIYIYIYIWHLPYDFDLDLGLTPFFWKCKGHVNNSRNSSSISKKPLLDPLDYIISLPAWSFCPTIHQTGNQCYLTPGLGTTSI